MTIKEVLEKLTKVEVTGTVSLLAALCQPQLTSSSAAPSWWPREVAFTSRAGKLKLHEARIVVPLMLDNIVRSHGEFGKLSQAFKGGHATAKVLWTARASFLCFFTVESYWDRLSSSHGPSRNLSAVHTSCTYSSSRSWRDLQLYFRTRIHVKKGEREWRRRKTRGSCRHNRPGLDVKATWFESLQATDRY
jgi:hypothetical protein